MGHEKSSVDWLPAGWKVRVRVRKSGKKDKCYVDPSNERKFFSKPEVLRYLNNVGISDPVCEETQNKSTSRRSAIKSRRRLQKDYLQGGLKKRELHRRAIKSGGTRYYVDPVSGHPFRSMKEVFRYLDTGKMRRQASKPKAQGFVNLEGRRDSLSPPAETGEKMIADSTAEKQFAGNQSLKSVSAVMSNDSLPEARKLEWGNQKEISSGSSTPAVEAPLENLQEGNGLEVIECKKKKRNHKKRADLPRRTSKRLAGIGADLSLVSNLLTRGRKAAGRQISEAEVSYTNKSENLDNLGEHAMRTKTGNEADEKQERHGVLPPGDIAVPEEHAKEGVPECNGEGKMEVTLDLPFSELWKDPCIEFAIKTLTGAMPIGDESKVAINQAASSNFSDVVPDSCQDLPSKDIWADPCFEFAVKTLTGDLPLGNDAAVEAILKQPSSHNLSQTIGHNGLTLPSYRSSGFSHSGVSFRHSNIAETPLHKQQL